MTMTKTKKPAAAAVPGKQKKTFPENAGIAHLLSLSQSITDAKSELLNKRIQEKKVKVQAQQLKKQKDSEQRKEKNTSFRPEARAKSKAEIKASLKAQKRDKAKLRKEKRKERAQMDKADAASVSTNLKGSPVKAKVEQKPRKSVSFALA